MGEAEAIGLALQQHSDWLLTDDAGARQFAESLGLEVHGSIGLILWAVASGLVENREQAYRMLNGLKRSALWISERVATTAAKAIDELTSGQHVNHHYISPAIVLHTDQPMERNRYLCKRDKRP